jgi:hypothetical protein
MQLVQCGQVATLQHRCSPFDMVEYTMESIAQLLDHKQGVDASTAPETVQRVTGNGTVAL